MIAAPDVAIPPPRTIHGSAPPAGSSSGSAPGAAVARAVDEAIAVGTDDGRSPPSVGVGRIDGSTADVDGVGDALALGVRGGAVGRGTTGSVGTGVAPGVGGAADGVGAAVAIGVGDVVAAGDGEAPAGRTSTVPPSASATKASWTAVARKVTGQVPCGSDPEPTYHPPVAVPSGSSAKGTVSPATSAQTAVASRGGVVLS